MHIFLLCVDVFKYVTTNKDNILKELLGTRKASQDIIKNNPIFVGILGTNKDVTNAGQHNQCTNPTQTLSCDKKQEKIAGGTCIVHSILTDPFAILSAIINSSRNGLSKKLDEFTKFIAHEWNNSNSDLTKAIYIAQEIRCIFGKAVASYSHPLFPNPQISISIPLNYKKMNFPTISIKEKETRENVNNNIDERKGNEDIEESDNEDINESDNFGEDTESDNEFIMNKTPIRRSNRLRLNAAAKLENELIMNSKNLGRMTPSNNKTLRRSKKKKHKSDKRRHKYVKKAKSQSGRKRI